MQNVHTIVSNILPMTSNVFMLYFVHSVNIKISPHVCQIVDSTFLPHISLVSGTLLLVVLRCAILCYPSLKSKVFEVEDFPVRVHDNL